MIPPQAWCHISPLKNVKDNQSKLDYISLPCPIPNFISEKKQKTYPTRFPTFTFTKPALGFLLEKPRRRAKVTHPRGGLRGQLWGIITFAPKWEGLPSLKLHPEKWMEDDFFPFSEAWPIFSDYVILRGCISWFWILFARSSKHSPFRDFCFFH